MANFSYDFEHRRQRLPQVDHLFFFGEEKFSAGCCRKFAEACTIVKEPVSFEDTVALSLGSFCKPT